MGCSRKHFAVGRATCSRVFMSFLAFAPVPAQATASCSALAKLLGGQDSESGLSAPDQAQGAPKRRKTAAGEPAAAAQAAKAPAAAALPAPVKEKYTAHTYQPTYSHIGLVRPPAPRPHMASPCPEFAESRAWCSSACPCRAHGYGTECRGMQRTIAMSIVYTNKFNTAARREGRAGCVFSTFKAGLGLNFQGWAWADSRAHSSTT